MNEQGSNKDGCSGAHPLARARCLLRPEKHHDLRLEVRWSHADACRIKPIRPGLYAESDADRGGPVGCRLWAEAEGGTGQFSELYRTRMDAAGEDHEQATLKRTYLSLLSHAALQELVLSIDAGTRPSVFPSDLRAEVQRIQAAAAVDTDADGEGSPDPQPAPAVASRAPSVPPPAGGPRTRAGAARAYAAALATSKDSAASGRPSPAPGGISFPRVGTPTSAPESQAAFAPIPQPYPALVVHLPSASSPIPAPTPGTPAPVTGSPPAPAWQSPTSEGGPGPVRNSSAKKTRTGVIGGFNPITAIGPSSTFLCCHSWPQTRADYVFT